MSIENYLESGNGSLSGERSYADGFGAEGERDDWDTEGAEFDAWSGVDDDDTDEDREPDFDDDEEDLASSSDYSDEDDDFEDDDAEKGTERGDRADAYPDAAMWDPQSAENAAAGQQQQVALYAAQQAELMAEEFVRQYGYEPSDEVRFGWMKQAQDQAWHFVQNEQSRRAQFRANATQHRAQFREYGLPENAADELAHIVDECGTGVIEDPYLKMLALELAVGRAVVSARTRGRERSGRGSRGSSMEMPTGLGEVRFSKAQSELIESVRKTVYGGRRLSLEEKRRIAGYM